MAEKRPAEQDNRDDDEAAPEPEDVGPRAKRRNRDQPEKEKSIFSGFGKTPSAPSAPSAALGFISNLDKKNEQAILTTDPVKILDTSENNARKQNLEYYINLKNLNLNFSKWIDVHIEKDPYCVLTRVFDDYTKYLIDIEKLKFVDKISAEKKETPNNEKTVNILTRLTGCKFCIKLDTSDNNADKQKLEEETLEILVRLHRLGLNFSNWIKSNPDKNPYCFPDFQDYMNSFNEIVKLISPENSNIED